MKKVLFIFVLTLAISSMAYADVANLASTKCANNGTYNATYMTRNYGLGTPTFAGFGSGWGVGNRYIAVEFDVSTITAPVTVSDTVITFTYEDHAWNSSSSASYAVSSFDSSWFEGTGTASAPGDCTADGSMCPNNVGTTTAITTAAHANTLADLVIDDALVDAVVEDWINGVSTNNGLYIGPEVESAGGIGSFSSDDSTAGDPLATAPTLDVTYSPAVSVGDWFLY